MLGGSVTDTSQDLGALLLFKLQAPFQSVEASRLPSALSFVTKREMKWSPACCLPLLLPHCNLSFPSLSSSPLLSVFFCILFCYVWGSVWKLKSPAQGSSSTGWGAAYLGLGHSACVGGMACASWPPRPLPKRCLKPPSIPCGHDNQNVFRLRSGGEC